MARGYDPRTGRHGLITGEDGAVRPRGPHSTRRSRGHAATASGTSTRCRAIGVDERLDGHCPPSTRAAQERLGYPTQKPEALLERIILGQQQRGRRGARPFCGCGTAIAVAQRLKRRWIGIDITHLAITLMKHRLQDAFGERGRSTTVIGEPSTWPTREQLAARTRTSSSGGRSAWSARGRWSRRRARTRASTAGSTSTTRATAARPKQIILSVKAGHIGVAHVRDLRGVLEREQAEIGVLITMEEPTQPMRTEAASAGFYQARKGPQAAWGTFRRLQSSTIAGLLAGTERLEAPPLGQMDRTFRKAPRSQANHEALALDLET